MHCPYIKELLDEWLRAKLTPGYLSANLNQHNSDSRDNPDICDKQQIDMNLSK